MQLVYVKFNPVIYWYSSVNTALHVLAIGRVVSGDFMSPHDLIVRANGCVLPALTDHSVAALKLSISMFARFYAHHISYTKLTKPIH